MNNEITKEKLRKNTVRTTGVAVFRKIRTLVDGFERQDNKNEKHSKILLVIFSLVILCLVYYFYINDRNYQTISSIYNKSFNVGCQNAYFFLPARGAVS